MVLRASGEPASATRTVPAFLIVGSTRSGTTLVQRLASEMPGVAIPPETHFFTHLAPKVVAAGPPIDAEPLRRLLTEYLAVPAVRGLGLDVDGVIDDLSGRCDSALDLFAAILRRLTGNAPAEGALVGEKTPLHVFWWQPIARAMPEVRFVATVRDPRGMVASNLAVRWGPRSHLLLAEAWVLAQRLISDAQNELGPERFLVLGLDRIDPAAAPRGPAGPGPGYLPWESWKERAWGPIERDRVEAWRSSLSRRESAEVAAVCRAGMERFGYETERPGRGAALATLARIPPVRQARRLG